VEVMIVSWSLHSTYTMPSHAAFPLDPQGDVAFAKNSSPSSRKQMGQPPSKLSA
jgi:hypothetical protein